MYIIQFYTTKVKKFVYKLLNLHIRFSLTRAFKYDIIKDVDKANFTKTGYSDVSIYAPCARCYFH